MLAPPSRFFVSKNKHYRPPQSIISRKSTHDVVRKDSEAILADSSLITKFLEMWMVREWITWSSLCPSSTMHLRVCVVLTLKMAQADSMEVTWADPF